MSTDNTALLRRLLEKGMTRSDASVVDELVAADYVNHDAPMPVHGPEGFRQLAAMFGNAFPDIRIVIKDEFADGDRVGTRGTITGTHQGDFNGITPTGNAINVDYQDLWRIEGGKFVETWVQFDMLGLMQQLGTVPAAGH
jgi:predicted ester cyclase